LLHQRLPPSKRPELVVAQEKQAEGSRFVAEEAEENLARMAWTNQVGRQTGDLEAAVVVAVQKQQVEEEMVRSEVVRPPLE
jgi:hypothetical protein